MRWLARVDPKPGTCRTVERFAWLPVRTVQDYYVWFEHYQSHEEYSRVPVYDWFGYSCGWALGWVCVRASIL